MEKILISACLIGARVRYDNIGKYFDDPDLRQWIAEGRLVPICPEVVAGLAVPRPSAEIIGTGGGAAVIQSKARVVSCNGEDVTDAYLEGAKIALNIAQHDNIQLAILKNQSPSCGSSKIYNGQFENHLIEGQGVTAALLQQNGVSVFSEHGIKRVKTKVSRQLSPHIP